DAVATANGNDVPHALGSQALRIEAVAVAAVDLQIEQRRRDPFGGQVGRRGRGGLDEGDAAGGGDDVDQFAGEVMTSAEAHGESRDRGEDGSCCCSDATDPQRYETHRRRSARATPPAVMSNG